MAFHPEIRFKTFNFECEERIWPHLQIIFEGEYDVPLFMKEPLILDIGANAGAFSIWAGYRWPGAKIIAYEPSRETFPILKRNIEKHSELTIIPVNGAVGKPGERLFYPGGKNSGESGFYSIIDNPNKPYSITVDDPLTLPNADIIKIDTEGCEVEILETLLKNGRRFSAIMYEYHREGDQKILEGILKDYLLLSAKIYQFNRGVMCYIHKVLYEGRG